jgi:amino acid permease
METSKYKKRESRMQSFQSSYTNKRTKPKRQLKLITIICATLIILGALSLAISITYESQTLAFIGLGLLFWGAILLFIQPEKYIKKVLKARKHNSKTKLDIRTRKQRFLKKQ